MDQRPADGQVGARWANGITSHSRRGTASRERTDLQLALPIRTEAGGWTRRRAQWQRAAVMTEVVSWGPRGAWITAISPGIIITPLAPDELTGPRGEGYRKLQRWMLELTRFGGHPELGR